MSIHTNIHGTTTQPASEHRKRGYRFYIRRALLVLAILLVALPILGLGYETIAAAIETRQFPAPGKLVMVNGHQMHINCTGQGGPTVVMP